MAVDKVEHLLKLAYMYCISTLKISYLLISACIANENHNTRVTLIDKKRIQGLGKGLARNVVNVFHSGSTIEFSLVLPAVWFVNEILQPLGFGL